MAGRKIKTWKIRQRKMAPNKTNERNSKRIFESNIEILQKLEAENRKAAAGE